MRAGFCLSFEDYGIVGWGILYSTCIASVYSVGFVAFWEVLLHHLNFTYIFALSLAFESSHCSFRTAYQ